MMAQVTPSLRLSQGGAMQGKQPEEQDGFRSDPIRPSSPHGIVSGRKDVMTGTTNLFTHCFCARFKAA